MFESMIMMIAPKVIGQISEPIKKMLFNIPDVLKENAAKTKTKMDDVLSVLSSIIFAVIEGDVDKAKNIMNNATDEVRGQFEYFIKVMNEKAKDTPNPYDNYVVALAAIIFSVELKG